MRILTFFNHAGGAGKSSTVRDIAYVLADRGFRVLVIDADPQANLTEWLGIRDEVNLEQTIYPALVEDVPPHEVGAELTLPEPVAVFNFRLIPSTLEVALAEERLMGQLDSARRLRDAVEQLEGYDFVLVDPPPYLGVMSKLSLIAGDYVVVPLPPNSKGRKGIKTIVATVKRNRRSNPRLRLLMAIVTNREHTRQDREMIEFYRESLQPIMPVSTPLTHRPAVYREAEHAMKPIPLYAPGDEADHEIRRVTDELLAALDVKVEGFA